MNDLIKALQPFWKSVAGALAGAVVIFLAKYNIIIDDSLADSLEVLLGAIITGMVVYFSPKNVEGR